MNVSFIFLIDFVEEIQKQFKSAEIENARPLKTKQYIITTIMVEHKGIQIETEGFVTHIGTKVT